MIMCKLHHFERRGHGALPGGGVSAGCGLQDLTRKHLWTVEEYPQYKFSTVTVTTSSSEKNLK